MPPQPPTPDMSPQMPAPQEAPKKKLPVIIGGVVVVLLVIMGGVLIAAHKHSDAATTTTANGKTNVSNAAGGKVAIKGLQLDAALMNGYEQGSARASQVSSLQQSLNDAGLANQMHYTGGTWYGTKSQTGGNGVLIYWGNIGSSYTDAGYTAKYDSYTKSQYAKLGAAATVSPLAALSIRASNGKTYSLPCELTATTGDAAFYTITCQGRLKDTDGFMSYSTLSQTQAEAQQALNTFISGTVVQL